MSEDLEAAGQLEGNGWPVDGETAERVPILKAPGEVLTPDERALDIELALIARRKWRQVSPHKPQLSCPLCGGTVADDERARLLHIEDHKRRELAATAAGLPPGHEVLTVDYASMAERATRHARLGVSAALVLMLALALTIVISVM